MSTTTSTDLLLVQQGFRWVPEEFWDWELKGAKIPGASRYFGQLAQIKQLHRGNKTRQWLELNWILQSEACSKLHLLTLQYQEDLFRRGLCFFEVGKPEVEDEEIHALLSEALILILSASFLRLKLDRLYLVTDIPKPLPEYPAAPTVWSVPLTLEAQLAYPDLDPLPQREVIALMASEWWQYAPAIAAHERLAYLSKRVVHQEQQERRKIRQQKNRPRRKRSIFGLF